MLFARQRCGLGRAADAAAAFDAAAGEVGGLDAMTAAYAAAGHDRIA
jgi:hypothetical protein